MKPELHLLTGPWRGRLAILARPRGDEWLVDEVRGWRAEGINVIVSLLTADENVELGLTEERQITLREGLEFVSFPIRDYGVPSSIDSMLRLSRQLNELLSAGKFIGIHCRQGIGRSGLVAACSLVMVGESAKEAIEHVTVSRGSPVPDTTEQRNWIYALADNLKSQPDLSIAS